MYFYFYNKVCVLLLAIFVKQHLKYFITDTWDSYKVNNRIMNNFILITQIQQLSTFCHFWVIQVSICSPLGFFPANIFHYPFKFLNLPSWRVTKEHCYHFNHLSLVTKTFSIYIFQGFWVHTQKCLRDHTMLGIKLGNWVSFMRAIALTPSLSLSNALNIIQHKVQKYFGC